MKSKLKFGLVGAGTHGRTAVIPGFLKSTECELLAIADANREALQQVEVPGLRHYDSLEAMTKQEPLDGIYIATLADTHCALAVTAFARGLHVVCEKPMAATAQEAEQLVKAATAAGRELCVMFENRVRPVHQKVRHWIAEGRIGRVEAIHLQSFGKHPTAQPRRTRLLNAAGCLDCGIHMLDLVRFWLGGGCWEVVHALGSWFGEAVERPPHIGLLARLDSGVMVTFEDSFSYGYGIESAPWNFGRNTLVIVGTKGVIRDGEVNGEPGIELISDACQDGVPFSPQGHPADIAEMLDLFSQAISGDRRAKQLLPSGSDGLEAQRIVDEINRQCIATAFRFHEHPVEGSHQKK